jgi:hypothetical protein
MSAAREIATTATAGEWTSDVAIGCATCFVIVTGGCSVGAAATPSGARGMTSAA